MTPDERIIILQAITGSRAYGLDHADSDTDRMGIFVAPTSEVLSLDWNASKETWSDAGPTGDDTTFHEVGKFLRLVLRGNPTLIEMLYMGEYEKRPYFGNVLVHLRRDLIAESNTRPCYAGYAKAQLREYINRPNPKDKMARHCLRIARQGVELLETGTTNVRVVDPQEYFELTEKPKDEIIRILEPEVEKIAKCRSVLPETPNREAADRYLKRVRHAYYDGQYDMI